MIVQENQGDFLFNRKIPKRVKTESSALTQALTDSVENGLMAFLAANFGLSLVFSSLLQYLWGLINTLQIVVLTVLFNLDIPENADNFMLMLLSLCSLEFIDTSEYLQMMFTFRETEAFGTKTFSDGTKEAKYADAGYESTIFLELLGPLFFMIIAMVAFMIVRKLLQKCAKPFNDNFCTRRLKKETANLVFIVRFILEGCIDIGLSALISVFSMSEESFSSSSETFSSILSFLFVLLLFLAPFAYAWLTR